MERLRYVVKFLNYAFFTKNHIQKLNQINDAIVSSFLIEEIRKKGQGQSRECGNNDSCDFRVYGGNEEERIGSAL